MDIIPVIDLKGGAVVRARRGRRDAYAPIETPLAAGSAPRDVVAGLMALYPFRTIYAADLDAIAKGGGHDDALKALADAFPAVNFWVDAGVADADVLIGLAGEKRLVLSLDFDDGGFRGAPLLLATQALWPARAIVMTLDKVGAGEGPDFERFAAIRRAGRTALYAAGGVRGAGDLADLARAGAEGALVASALHDGVLTAGDIMAAAAYAPAEA